MRKTMLATAILTFGLLTSSIVGACTAEMNEQAGDTGTTQVDEPDTSTASTTQPPDTTTIAVTTTTQPTTTSGEASTQVTSDLVYHQDDNRFVNERELIDVVTPTAGDAWPVVVVFHGDPRAAGKEWSLPMATELAERGRLVFVPDWGHTSSQWQSEVSLKSQWDLLVQQLRCAVVFAKANAPQFGGDPDHITLMGYSAGGNATLMAALSDAEPLDSCVEPGPGVEPQAAVSIEGDLLIGAPAWDTEFAPDPETFYGLAPWRDLDPSDRFPIYVVVAEDTSGAQRSVGSDPAASFLVTRHTDIDLIADLDEMDVLNDGVFSNLDANQWAYEAFLAAGYDTTWVLLPDSRHAMLGDTKWAMSDEAWDLAIDTVVNAERVGSVSVEISGMVGEAGNQLAGVLVRNPAPNREGVGGFAVTVDSDPFSETLTLGDVSEEWGDSEASEPWPWASGVARVPAGDYTLWLWSGEDYCCYGRWVPADSPGLHGCQLEITTTGEDLVVRVSEIPRTMGNEGDCVTP